MRRDCTEKPGFCLYKIEEPQGIKILPSGKKYDKKKKSAF
jgi:hypothetical protein